MRVLALDLGTKLGFYSGGSRADTIHLGKGDERFKTFAEFLDYPSEITELIIYEEAAFQIGNAIPIYHGLVGVLKSFCLRNGIKYIGIPVGTIKKNFTGKGNCDKLAIMKRCDELGIKYDTDNAADAYATYYTYKELYGQH